jgi:iron complex outermembrane receptor protein
VDNGQYHNQGIVPAFSNLNTYINYTIRNRSILDGTKIRLGANNLLGQHNLTALGLTGSALTQTIPSTTFTDPFNTTGPTPISGSDTPTFLSARSLSVSVTFGFAPKERK